MVAKKKTEFAYIGWHWSVDLDHKVWIRENVQGGNQVQGQCMGRLEAVSYREKQKVPAQGNKAATSVACVWLSVEGKKQQICLSVKTVTAATSQLGARRTPCAPRLESWIRTKSKGNANKIAQALAGNIILSCFIHCYDYLFSSHRGTSTLCGGRHVGRRRK
jgi:hypothetical protein